jgi:hypothetical protein
MKKKKILREIARIAEEYRLTGASALELRYIRGPSSLYWKGREQVWAHATSDLQQLLKRAKSK